MKKAISILLAVLMLAVMFTGCGKKATDPLCICLDLQGSLMIDPEADFYDIAGILKTNGIIGDYEIILIPKEDPERSTMLDNIRTDIMAGKGPDVFIIGCVRDDHVTVDYESLFPMPEKAMENGLFLPLDEYIENAEYGEWDTFRDVVMAAGRNEEGQQLIPIAYTLPVAVYRAEDTTFSYDKKTTWEDMLSTDALYSLTAPLADGTSRYYSTIGWSSDYRDTNINYVLGDLADFRNDELLFTEEDLFQRTREILEMKDYVNENKLNQTEGWYEDYLGYRFDACAVPPKNGISSDEDINILPICSDDGGVTATITAYAAVNRNTYHPEEAFKVIDRLLYHSVISYSNLYRNFIYIYGDQGSAVPMNEALFIEKMNRGSPQYQNYMYLKPQKQEQFFYTLDQITHVEFADTLHSTLENMMFSASMTSNEEDLQKIVHEYYEIMKYMMSE